MSDPVVDVAIIGGGVNGCGIARDAAGRGMSVYLCEMGDLAQGTSSASTKLFHGGLRYLEYYEFRLVREALVEREVLLRAMPHISWPMRFILPHHQGLRPAWLLRLGLFIYDHLGGRKILPPTKVLRLGNANEGAALRDRFRVGFEYSDCWVQDSRLVVLNARDAAARGAEIDVGTQCLSAHQEDNIWHIDVREIESGATKTVRARALVNAGGPWVDELISNCLRIKTSDRIRLVRGSHIVVPKLFEHEKAYIFQNADGRIIFAIPYEDDFTLIGTTDRDHDGSPSTAECTDEEIDYLCASASEYFEKPVTPDAVVWTYSGVRPLYDDGSKSATAATRDYILKVEQPGGTAPLLNVFGGKITTYRRLAEAALGKLKPFFPAMSPPWTAGIALPGGDFPVHGAAALTDRLHADYPFVDRTWAARLMRTYGTDAAMLLGDARDIDDLGQQFGATLTESEVRWLMDREWARHAEDVVWRRTKLGLHLSPAEIETLEVWMQERRRSTNGHSAASDRSRWETETRHYTKVGG